MQKILLGLVVIAAIIWGVGFIGDKTPAPNRQPTALPTATATQALTYKQIALNHVDNLIEALGKIGPILKQARVNDPDWKTEIGLWIGQAQSSHEYLMKLQPPPEMTEIHVHLTTATAKCYASTEALATGIDKSDLELMGSSVTLLQACYNDLASAVEELKATD